MYQLDVVWLERLGGVPSELDIGASDRKSFPYCNSFGISMSTGSRHCLEVYMLLHSLVVLLYDGYTLFLASQAQRRFKYLLTNISGKKQIQNMYFIVFMRFVNLFVAILTITLIVLMQFLTDRESALASVVTFLRTLHLVTSLSAILNFFQIVPAIGHIIIYMRMMITDMILHYALLVFLLAHFIRAFMWFFAGNSEQGCIDKFSTYIDTAYTLFMTFLDQQNFSDFKVLNISSLQLYHICFWIGVLLQFNLLIAMMNDSVKEVAKNRKTLVAFSQLWIVGELDYTLVKIPIVSQIYLRMRNASVKRNFYYKDGRVYLVHRKNAVKCKNLIY